MKVETHEALAALCDTLKSKGVRAFSVDGIRVEFGAPPDDTKTAAPEVDPDLCKCGHPNYAHTNGLCIHGCDPEKCIDPAKNP